MIGPGGKVIRAIQETTNTKLDVDDAGLVTIFSPDMDALERAEAMVNELTQEAELDRVYLGKVKRITDFGAFVEIFPGTDGLIHISHLAEGRVEKVTDVVQRRETRSWPSASRSIPRVGSDSRARRRWRTPSRKPTRAASRVEPARSEPPRGEPSWEASVVEQLRRTARGA